MAQCSILHDVLIIGAGPCSLAVAARLCETTPSAIFSDTEHHRYHWIKKHGDRASIKDRRTGQTKTPKDPRECRNYSTLVLDGTDKDWMSRWNHLFKTFEISHLRSPMFFHPDPQDRDGLLSFTYEHGRDKELVEIPECVGKEISKHKKKQRLKCKTHGARPPVTIDERDRKDYFTPSCSLFHDYCECVIDRYGLRSDLIHQERVEDIDFGFVPGISETKQIFTVHSDQDVHYARVVVLAVGPGNPPSIPAGLGQTGQGCCHAMQIREFPDHSVTTKLHQKKDVNIVVVGGGLTSAQLTVMASKHGARKVFHLVRGRLRVKPFDVDLDWMGKFRNFEEASFWSADTDEERLEKIKEARGGGSITPRYHKLLKQYIAAGKVAMHTETTITSSSFSNGSWILTTSPPIELPSIDYIYFATGIASDFRSLPFLQTINHKFPIDSYGGLPALTDDLMWKENVPLFVTGRLAALRLGPGAGNLAGARSGAERIAWAIEDILPKEDGQTEDEEEDEMTYNFKTGTGSQFCSLDSEACI
ncbi:FAD/NAD(P)-binding domain-containing protein [Aureobasidium sp. EXF-3400]|nr:FAD/NAD(P)-binding domain-containing protein [Aureobasidium sp. EXF-3400]